MIGGVEMKHYLFGILCCLFLLSGLANASEYLSISASYGWVWFHPEAVANNYKGDGVSWGLGLEKPIK